MRIRLSRLRIWLVYTLAALLVIAPLLPRGYVLTLDMVFAPHARMPATVSNGYLFYAFLHGLNFVLPGDVIEKILLLTILLLAGVGMHRLVEYLGGKTADRPQKIGAYFAGTLYMVNPFTYDRLMAGQYLVLLGYALLPWFVRALLEFLDKPAVRRAVVMAVWAAIVGIVSIHAIGFMAILVCVAISLKIWREREHKTWLRKLLKFGLISLGIFLIASSYWLVPLALGKGSTAGAIDNFGAGDRTAFATIGGSWIGRFGNVLSLQGFWAEARNMYTLPQDVVPAWTLLTLLVWALVITGIISLWRAGKRDMVLLFGISASVAAILAIGTLNGWLAAHVPLFSGYREPEKFVALIALLYAVFAAHGVIAVLKYCHVQAYLFGRQGGKFFLSFASLILLLLPIVWTPTMLWGANNQLAPVQYPADWFTMNQRLDADRSNFQTLFLPWHLYLSFDFSGRIIANPGPSFFDKPMIISDNPEFGGAAAAGSTSATRSLDAILPAVGSGDALGTRLAPLNIKYVLLARDGDGAAAYGYLSRQADLKLVAKTATLELYRNEAWR